MSAATNAPLGPRSGVALASTLADLNTALTEANAWSELAREVAPADDQSREFDANVREALGRVGAAIRDLYPLFRQAAASTGPDHCQPAGARLVLRTPRLLLRPLAPTDAGALARYRGLPAVARYQSWDWFTVADGERLVADQQAVAPDTPGTWLQLGMVADDALVGDLGVHTRADDPRQVELGITLDPAHQGRGYAAEALTAVLDHLFGAHGKHRVTATTDAANAPAAALFTRLGFRKEGHFLRNVWFKGAWGDEFLFALLKDEWVARVVGAVAP
jgi:RimJ/RimL family protein N-acetyltransferase